MCAEAQWWDKRVSHGKTSALETPKSARWKWGHRPITQLLKKLRKGIYEFKASLDNMIKIKITKWARDTAQWPNASPASPGINVTYWEKRWMGSLRLCKQ